MGIRVVDIPLVPGTAIVSGASGLHPVKQVEAAARAPYPVAGDIVLNGVSMREAMHLVRFCEQRYDFSTGELTTRFEFRLDGVVASAETLTFCSRAQPTLVLQQTSVTVDGPADLTLRAIVDPGGIPGRYLRRQVETPGEPQASVDGSLLWETLGAMSRIGVAYDTEFVGSGDVTPGRAEWGEQSPLASDYRVRARSGRRYGVRQIAGLVPSVLHSEPDRQAVRLVSQAASAGFDELRRRNRASWDEVWRARIVVDGPGPRWQELTDAAMFYLLSSTHLASPSSTSIFGLAQWTDYHYYYGHIMWDIETFSVPVLTLLNPPASRSLLGFRTRTMDAARSNAKMAGHRGLRFPWEAGATRGEETAPGAGSASWFEDHVSIDVAFAFAQYAHATGDGEFLEMEAWPILHGVADWIASRVTETPRGFELHDVMGIAEREEPSNNEAFTLMGAAVVLREAIACAERLGRHVPPEWRRVADGLVLPMDADRTHVISHDGWRSTESKGATPGPLAGIFPVWYPLPADVEQATLRRYLDLADSYVGSPMLSAFYGVWACWAGDRARAARLLDEGYAQLHAGRFLQTLETRPDRAPETPRAGPFFANLGAYLSGLLYGFPALRIGPEDPATWPQRPVVLPEGWRSIEVERAWIRGRPVSIVARHGADRAELRPAD
jgi:trehalose/maltose hydrolase-like predicted phosphorylase